MKNKTQTWNMGLYTAYAAMLGGGGGGVRCGMEPSRMAAHSLSVMSFHCGNSLICAGKEGQLLEMLPSQVKSFWWACKPQKEHTSSTEDLLTIQSSVAHTLGHSAWPLDLTDRQKDASQCSQLCVHSPVPLAQSLLIGRSCSASQARSLLRSPSAACRVPPHPATQ